MIGSLWPTARAHLFATTCSRRTCTVRPSCSGRPMGSMRCPVITREGPFTGQTRRFQADPFPVTRHDRVGLGRMAITLRRELLRKPCEDSQLPA